MCCVDEKERDRRVIAEAKTFSWFFFCFSLFSKRLPTALELRFFLGARCCVLVSVTAVVTTAACKPCFVSCCR